ncbi:MAG: hypothetical protein ABSD74_16940 [Rhizomicrobium sp.]
MRNVFLVVFALAMGLSAARAQQPAGPPVVTIGPIPIQQAIVGTTVNFPVTLLLNVTGGYQRIILNAHVSTDLSDLRGKIATILANSRKMDGCGNLALGNVPAEFSKVSIAYDQTHDTGVVQLTGTIHAPCAFGIITLPGKYEFSDLEIPIVPLCDNDTKACGIQLGNIRTTAPNIWVGFLNKIAEWIFDGVLKTTINSKLMFDAYPWMKDYDLKLSAFKLSDSNHHLLAMTDANGTVTSGQLTRLIGDIVTSRSANAGPPAVTTCRPR